MTKTCYYGLDVGLSTKKCSVQSQQPLYWCDTETRDPRKWQDVLFVSDDTPKTMRLYSVDMFMIE